MNILILGGAGFVGSNLVRRCLRSKKNKITVVDSLEPRLRSTADSLKDVLNNITFIKGDIRDANLMKKVVKRKDVIFNCAGQTSHPLSLKDPFFDVELNCNGNLQVLEAVRLFNPKARLVYTSSSTVIGKALYETVDENHRELPLDIYSAHKGVVEKYYHIYHKAYGLKTLVLRFANLYGPYGKNSPDFGFVNYFISLAYNNKPLPIFGRGNQSRNIMYIEDAVDLLYKTSQNRKLFGKVYFAVHREHVSVLQIAKKIIEVFGKGKIVKKKWPVLRKRIEIDDVVISGAKLFYETQWEPKYSLEGGLKRTKDVMDLQTNKK